MEKTLAGNRMKTIGLLGGMSWESTAIYYRAINEEIKKTLGGYHSAKIILNSLEFSELEAMMQAGRWQEISEVLVEGAKTIEAAGADFMLICSNTMHKNAPAVRDHINIPLLHIADATGEALVANGIKKVGLLGTTFTMEQDYYKGYLTDQFGLEVVVPDSSDRFRVHEIIDEICMGQLLETSKNDYRRMIDDLKDRGAQAAILGCTEIGILIEDGEASIPLYDTTLIHSKAAVKMALE